LIGVGLWAALSGGGGKSNGDGKKPSKVNVAKVVPKRPTNVRVEFPGHWGDIWCLAWSPDGSSLASGATDGEVRIWDPVTQENQNVYRGHQAGIYEIAWSADGRKLASLDLNGEIHISDTFGTQPLHRLQSGNPSQYVGGMAFSPQGDELACAEEGGIVRWNLKSEQPSDHLPFASTATLRYSPKGTYLAAADSKGAVVVWKTNPQSEHFRIPTNGKMRAIRFTPDESLILIEQGRVEIWDCTKKEKQREHLLPDLKFAIAIRRSQTNNQPLCEVSPSGKHCLICTTGGTMSLDLITGEKPVRPLDGFEERFVLLSVSPRLNHCAIAWLGQIRVAHFQLGRIGDPFGFDYLFDGGGWRPPRILADRYLKCRRLLASNHIGWYPCWDLSTGEMLADFPENAHIDGQGQLRAVVDDRIEFWPSPQDLNSNPQTTARLNDAQEAIDWNKRVPQSFYPTFPRWNRF
jgi:WD40 repeat protein